MSRMRRGWALTKKSWALLRENPALMRFPVYGAVGDDRLRVGRCRPRPLSDRRRQRSPSAVPWRVIGFYFLAVIGTYFSVGLAAAADMIFHGERCDRRDGLAVARRPLRPDLRLGRPLHRRSSG